MGTIIASCVTAAVTLATCLVTNGIQHNKTISLIDYRLVKLEEKVDKHNNVIERTYKLEQDTALQEEKIKVANNRIKDLETEVEKIRE